MHLSKIKPQYYSFAAITVLLLGVIACRDFEDCRSMYTNITWVKFKGENELEIDKFEYHKPHHSHIFRKENEKVLQNLKDNPIKIYLHPKNNIVTLLFYRTQADTTSPTNPDTLTIFYHTVNSLLSPSCGIQQEYIIDSVETSFVKSTILKRSLKEGAHETSEEKKNPNVEIQY